MTGKKNHNNSKSIKIAIACPGVGLVQRGFERMFFDLFHLLKDDMDITLFKGGGLKSKNEIVLKFLPRNGTFLRWFPIHKLVGRTTIHVECFTFAISLLLALRGKGYNVIHCTDPPLARILYKIRKLFRLNFILLYSEACAMPPTDYPPADHMHQISQVTYEDALSYGIPEKYMTVIPLGLYSEKFIVNTTNIELRRKYNIPDNAFIIISVAAINRYHKRIDYLLDEFNSVTGNVLLWIDGSLDQGDPDLVQYASNLLGDRCRITHLPTSQVGELFALADLMVHASLFEAFGLAIIEGASTGIPMLTHNAPHFIWLLGCDECSIDMSIKGALSSKINELVNNQNKLENMKVAGRILKNYHWNVLKKEYINMYLKASSIPASDIGVANKYGLK